MKLRKTILALLVLVSWGLAATFALAEDTVPLADPTLFPPVEEKQNLETPPPYKLSPPCLNCSEARLNAFAGMRLQAVPNGGTKADPYFEFYAESPLAFGGAEEVLADGTIKPRKVRLRGFARFRITTRTKEVMGEEQLLDVERYAGAGADVGLKVVVGEGYGTTTALYGKIGARIAFSEDAKVDPKVAKSAEAGINVFHEKSGADFFLGGGFDQDGLPATMPTKADGTLARAFMVLFDGRMPIKGTKQMVWVVLSAAINILEVEGSRDTFGVGIVAGLDHILEKL